ncbi:MAG TPA: potassium transporter [Desulfobacterales bacterium]
MTTKAKTIWILGAGRFGQIAIQRLHRKHPSAMLTVVDRHIQIPSADAAQGIDWINADAITFLAENLQPEKGRGPDWIIPAVPLHVAFEWICRRLESRFTVEKVDLPDTITKHLPNIIEGGPGTLYTSVADFICPDDCPEPAQICTHTGQPRPCTLYRELENFQQPGWKIVVVRSRQLLPGVGGYRPEALFQALQKVESASTPILLATACRCHAVVDAFQLHHT